MVYQELGNLKGFLKPKRTIIDHATFRLYYRFTVAVLLVFCIIVTTKQYGGEPIKCTQDSKSHSDVIDIYCLVTTTYTVKSGYNNSLNSIQHAPHPGIKPSENREEYLYHSYYQYVGFVLFLQAVMFYFPHWLWKTMEGGRVEWLVSGIDTRLTSFQKGETEAHRSMILDYLYRSWGHTTMYPWKYFFCEILCFINVLSQLCALNVLFNDRFFHYGFDIISYWCSGSSGLDPMIKLFPRVTSCSFKYFGETGKIVQVSVLCILSINVINEKIYTFLWFWLFVLLMLSVWAITFRLVTYWSKKLQTLILFGRFRHVDQTHLKTLVDKGSLDDWFLIHLIGQNVDDIHFRNFVSDLAEQLSYNIVKSP